MCIQFDHFKELGRFISVDLKAEIRRRFEKDFDLVDRHYVSLVKEFGRTGVRTFRSISHGQTSFTGPGAFVLNAQINSVRIPDMLHIRCYSVCSVVKTNKYTLHHVLVNCPFALYQGRYSWRHDSVLQDLDVALTKLVETFNSKTPPKSFC